MAPPLKKCGLTYRCANSLVCTNPPFQNATSADSSTTVPGQPYTNTPITTSSANVTSSVASFAQPPPCPYSATVNATTKSVQTCLSPAYTSRSHSTSSKSHSTFNTSWSTFSTSTTFFPPVIPPITGHPPGEGRPITGTVPGSQTTITSGSPSPPATTSSSIDVSVHSVASTSITTVPQSSSKSRAIPSFIISDNRTSGSYIPSFAPYHTYTTRPTYPVLPSTTERAAQQKLVGTIVGTVCGVVTFFLAMFAIGAWYVHRRGVKKAGKMKLGISGETDKRGVRKGPWMSGAVGTNGRKGGAVKERAA